MSGATDKSDFTNPNYTKGLCSIILPIYRKTYLERTLESISRQTHENWQLVIINDKSEDDMEDIISKFTAQHGNKLIYLQNKFNQGVGISDMLALQRCTGEFVAQIGHDDVMAPDFLEKQIECLNAMPDAIATFSKVKYINSKGSEETHHQLFRNNIINNLNRHDLFIDLIKSNFLCACSGVFRNVPQAARLLGYANDTLQDLELWCNLLMLGKFHYNENTSLQYRIHDSNFSLKNKKLAQILFEESSCIMRILFSESFYKFYETSNKELFLKSLIRSLLSHKNNKMLEIITPAFLEYIFSRDNEIAPNFKYELAKLYQSIGLIFKAYTINDSALPVPFDVGEETRNSIKKLDELQLPDNISEYLTAQDKNNIFSGETLLKEIELELLSDAYHDATITDTKVMRDSTELAEISYGLGGIIENKIIQDDFITYQGWAANLNKKNSRPKAILAFSDGQIVGQALPQYFRKDIHKFFGRQGSHVGFSLMTQKRHSEVELVAIFDDGTARKLSHAENYVRMLNLAVFIYYRLARLAGKFKRLIKNV